MFVGCSLPQKIGRKMIPKYDLQILQIAFKRCFGAKKLIPPPKVAESPRKCRCTNKQTRWWFQIFFIFFPYLGKISNLTNVFQLDWKPPTSKQTNKPTNQPTKTRINTHRRWCPFFSQGATSLLLPLWLPLKSPTRRRSK